MEIRLMTKETKYQLYILINDLQTNLIRLHAEGTTGTLMDDSLDKLNQMMGYFIISGIDKVLDEKAEESKDALMNDSFNYKGNQP